MFLKNSFTIVLLRNVKYNYIIKWIFRLQICLKLKSWKKYFHCLLRSIKIYWVVRKVILVSFGENEDDFLIVYKYLIELYILFFGPIPFVIFLAFAWFHSQKTSDLCWKKLIQAIFDVLIWGKGYAFQIFSRNQKK